MIEVKGLTKRFKGQTVLNGIDLTVQPGEVVAIIGPSGSGKTTFLRCLNLLETPDAGQIKIGAISIDANRPLGGSKVRSAGCASRPGSCSRTSTCSRTAQPWKT